MIMSIPLRTSPLLLAAIGFGILFFLYAFVPFYSNQPYSSHNETKSNATSNSYDGNWNTERDRSNLLLNDQQCSVAFPELYQEIERAVRDRGGKRISLEELEQVPRSRGYVRGMIHNGELFVLDKEGDVFSRELATLNAMYRSVVTSPEPIPDIEFTFGSDDFVELGVTWAYARREEDKQLWLMPDFGFWSWPETKVGSYNVVQQKAIILEEGDVRTGRPPMPFQSKLDQLVWRGVAEGLDFRVKFVQATRGQPWSDVKEIGWHDGESGRRDLLTMDEHCKYKFVAHTEGRSYSGRLKYLQNCRSVVVAHTLEWIQHYHHLMLSSGPEQNFVEVQRDFSDLKDKMTFLLNSPDVAEKIADKSVKVFRERYLTPAAQACYWRKFFKAWASVSFEPQRSYSNGSLRGVPFEDYVLERRLQWDPY